MLKDIWSTQSVRLPVDMASTGLEVLSAMNAVVTRMSNHVSGNRDLSGADQSRLNL